MGVKISPSNRWFAVYTSEYYKTTPGQQTLYLYSFPDGKLQWQQSLLSPYLATSAASITITDRSTVGDVYHSILQASSEQNWSPDSRYFAFASAHEGQSADLYVFDTQRLTTTRLTDGPAQIGDIQWSPDSQWVLHQGVVSFDTGNTWIVDAFWAASVNGEVRLLAHDAQRSLYRRVTWLSDQEFLAVTQRPTGNNALLYISIADPSNNLQLFDIPGFISNVRYHPDTRQIDVVVFDPDSGTLQHVQRWALWSVFMDGRVPQKLKETENQEITLP